MAPAEPPKLNPLTMTEGRLASQCRALAESLGLTVPIPPGALAAALADESYYNQLFLHRTNLPRLMQLLANPPKGAPGAGAPPHSSGELIRNAASAYWQWGRAGFPQVALAVLEKRESACLACPHLTEPAHPLQKAVTLGWSAELIGRRIVGKVCALCGCGIARKIRLPAAACPAAAPDSPGLTRWGEPVGEPEAR